MESEDLKREEPWLWWGTLAGPFVVLFGGVLVLALFRGGSEAAELLGRILLTFFALGKLAILTGTDNSFFSTVFLAGMVVMLDLLTATVCIFHLGWLYRIPRLGPILVDIQQDGRIILEQNPWMRRATMLAIVVFVTFPLAATGAVGGVLFGRLLGLGRLRTMIGIALGSLLGSGIMVLASEGIGELLKETPDWIRIAGGLILVGGLILILNSRYRAFRRRRRERDRPR
ncbi:MAG: small multi-drug export protein [Planctomycetota bacterium]